MGGRRDSKLRTHALTAQPCTRLDVGAVRCLLLGTPFAWIDLGAFDVEPSPDLELS